MIASNATVIATALFCGKKRKKRCPDEARVSNWWEEGLNRWNEEAFKDNFRVNRGTYEFILREIEGYLTKNRQIETHNLLNLQNNWQSVYTAWPMAAHSQR